LAHPRRRAGPPRPAGRPAVLVAAPQCGAGMLAARPARHATPLAMALDANSRIVATELVLITASAIPRFALKSDYFMTSLGAVVASA